MRRVAANLAIGAFVLCLTPGQAYIQNQRSTGAPLRRSDFGAIPYLLDQTTRPGLRNEAGHTVITADSDPLEAVLAALRTWSEIPSSLVRFAELEVGPGMQPQSDRRHLITFADSPTTRTLVDGAVAVTFLFSNPAGELVDTDIVFNPELPFSTTLQPGTFDIQATLTHELGHALGLDHSGIVSATMFAITTRAANRGATLTQDDAAFVQEVYPAAGGGDSQGELVGSIRRPSGVGVPGSFVVAVDSDTNTMLGSISEPDGRYRIGPLPPGRYLVYAEPLDGPAETAQLGPSRQSVASAFRTGFAGGRRTPDRIPIIAGAGRRADVIVEDGPPSLNIGGGGTAPMGARVQTLIGGAVRPGGRYEMEVFGEGLDQPEVTEASLSFLGSGIAVVPDSLDKGTIRFEDEALPLLRFQIEVPADTPPGLASLSIATSSEIAVFTGGVEITEPFPRPAFTADGVANAASFLTGSLAPGEIFAIFGDHLGPELGVAGSFDANSGRLKSLVGGVSVTLDGVPAPLFFVSRGQINAQAPFELAGRSAVQIVVSYNDEASAAVVVPVTPTDPGLFTFPGTESTLILNQDGSLNDAAHPARRGSFVSLFGTGQGALDPPLGTGQVAAGPGSLSRFVQDVQASVGSRPAAVSFAGMAPGFVGLFQVNLRVPMDAPLGPQTRLSVEIGGAATQPDATMAVE